MLSPSAGCHYVVQTNGIRNTSEVKCLVFPRLLLVALKNMHSRIIFIFWTHRYVLGSSEIWSKHSELFIFSLFIYYFNVYQASCIKWTSRLRQAYRMLSRPCSSFGCNNDGIDSFGVHGHRLIWPCMVCSTEISFNGRTLLFRITHLVVHSCSN